MSPQNFKASAAGSSEFNFLISLMSHLAIPTFVLGADGKIIIWNKACERLTGISSDDIIGTSTHWRAFYNEERPCLADLVMQNRFDEIESLYTRHEHNELNSNEFVIHADSWCPMPHVGRNLYLSIDVGPIYDNEGNLLAVVETLRDITAEKETTTELEHMAMRDGLTGLSNRRHFESVFSHEWCRLFRDKKPFSLLMVDIDFFKLYNDRYGHLAGDDCLRSVSQALGRSVFRACDIVARYGGEEFAIILPDTPSQEAEVVALRVMRKIASLNMVHEDNNHKVVSVSVGLATLVPSGEFKPEQLIWMADEALYRAKKLGRNRFVINNTTTKVKRVVSEGK